MARLSGPSRLSDPSWIRPGKSTSEWLYANHIYGVDFKSGYNTETYKFYIDFASRFGLEYVLFDAGWSNPQDMFDLTDPRLHRLSAKTVSRTTMIFTHPGSQPFAALFILIADNRTPLRAIPATLTGVCVRNARFTTAIVPTLCRAPLLAVRTPTNNSQPVPRRTPIRVRGRVIRKGQAADAFRRVTRQDRPLTLPPSAPRGTSPVMPSGGLSRNRQS